MVIAMSIISNRRMTWRFAEITRGMTQEQIAEKLNCSVGQVNMMLSGKRKFHTHWITRIAEAWGIPEWQLFTTGEEIYPKSDKALVEAYLRAPAHKQQTVRDILGINHGSDDNGNGVVPPKAVDPKKRKRSIGHT